MERSKVQLQVNALLQIFSRKIGNSFLSRVFRVWVEESYRNRRIYHSGMKLLLRWRHFVALGAFQAWFTQTFEKRMTHDLCFLGRYRNEQIFSCIVARKKNADLKASWNIWLNEFLEQRRMGKAAFRVIFHHQDRTLFGALMKWLNYFMRQRRLASKAQKLRNSTRFISMYSFFFNWARETRLNKAIMSSTRRMSRDSKAWVLEAWGDARKQLRKMKIIVDYLINHICRCAASENNHLMFGAWKSQVSRKDLFSEIVCPLKAF
jgi:hypothetical protein